MALTRSFKDTVVARLRRDGAFRKALLAESIECLLNGELEAGKSVLRDYIHATVGFMKLAEETGKSPKSLMRMLGPSGNPQARNLFEVVAYLQQAEGVKLSVKATKIAA